MHDVLQDIFRLTHHAGFSAEYIESISPLDRKLNWLYWQQAQEESKKQEGVFTALDGNIPNAINM